MVPNRAWKSNCIIHKLPPELLCSIFLILHADENRADDDDLESWDMDEGNNTWFQVAGVCSAWRHVVNTLPALFQDVHIKRRREWAELCFDRSKGSSGSLPVTVTVHVASILPSVLDLLSVNGPRIRRLCLHDCTEETIRLLQSLLGPYMTALTDLLVSAGNSNAGSGTELAASFVPSLRSLYLFNATVADWNAPVFSRLRRLHLGDFGYSASGDTIITFDAFLRGLQACQTLEELALNLYEWPFDPYNGAGDGRNMSSEVFVHLPSIRMAHFLCPCSGEPDSPEIFHLLSHFRFPVTADVMVYSQVYDYDHRGRGGLLHTIPQDASALPILTNASSGMICAHSCQVSLDGHSGEGRLAVDLEDMHQPVGENWGYSPSHLLRDFCTLFARSPLQKLTVRIEHKRDEWRQLFRTFPGLRSLSLDGEYVSKKALPQRLRAVMCALSPASGGKDEVLVPVLRSLTLENLELDRDMFRGLYSCLVVRSEHRSKLSALHLRLYAHSPPHPTNDEMIDELGLDDEALVDEQVTLEELRREGPWNVV